MNTRLFRQVALARLSSPEQLDQILRITGAKEWLGLVAITVLFSITAVWGYKGSIPTTSIGQGVIVRTGGVQNVVARGSGLVKSVKANVGDRIAANQIVAHIAQPVLEEKIKAMRQALAEVREQHERSLGLRARAVTLAVDALNRQRANQERTITELDEQAKLAAEQITVEDQLLGRGLVTKQSTIAARQKLIGLRDQIEAGRALLKQLDSQKYSLESQPEQDDAEARFRISTYERDLREAEKQLSLAEEVVSPYAGEVIELKLYAGGTVAAGEPVLSIQSDLENLEILAYLPSGEAKDAGPGMEVQVSPGMIKREEFGFMIGRVERVADYPATSAAIMRNFQNETLAHALLASGPITEVRVRLERDPKTVSGYKWSSSKGPAITISSGTICNVQVVTRRQKPITLLLPYAKSKLGLD
jgi:HlyD family secretion protein